jgi:hypothetical protein
MRIKVKYVPSKLKGVLGWNGKKWFIVKWKKH